MSWIILYGKLGEKSDKQNYKPYRVHRNQIKLEPMDFSPIKKTLKIPRYFLDSHASRDCHFDKLWYVINLPSGKPGGKHFNHWYIDWFRDKADIDYYEPWAPPPICSLLPKRPFLPTLPHNSSRCGFSLLPRDKRALSLCDLLTKSENRSTNRS